MKPSHKNPAPAVVVVVVVSAVVAAVAIAAGAVVSNKAPTSCSCGRGASVEAPLHALPRSLIPHIQCVVANVTQSIATPLVATSDRLPPICLSDETIIL